MSPTQPKDLRSGWTTGTCASAAAKAAAIEVVEGLRVDQVEVGIPNGTRVTFDVQWTPDGPSVIKDAGDDPDCTHGASIIVSLARIEAHQVQFAAGKGVGTITKPGIGLDVGDPAINPVPRRMIAAAIREVTDEGFLVTISVPHGEEMAKKTTNDRLGILGGISILGTTGIVRPFSTAAYRASVVQQIDVAAAQGITEIVLATGSRSEALAMRLFDHLDVVSFVEVGDFTGVALKRCKKNGIAKVVWVGMAGKITKLAGGYLMTHFHRSALDNKILLDAANDVGASPAVVVAATETETARHFFEVCLARGEISPLTRLCEMAAWHCRNELGDEISFSLIMSDFEGTSVIARA